jgi:hypothetical protein
LLDAKEGLRLELLHGKDYEGGKKESGDYKHVAEALKKRVMLVFENETTITQKPCKRKSMSIEGKHQKTEHNGSRRKLSVYSPAV